MIVDILNDMFSLHFVFVDWHHQGVSLHLSPRDVWRGKEIVCIDTGVFCWFLHNKKVLSCWALVEKLLVDIPHFLVVERFSLRICHVECKRFSDNLSFKRLRCKLTWCSKYTTVFLAIHPVYLS